MKQGTENNGVIYQGLAFECQFELSNKSNESCLLEFNVEIKSGNGESVTCFGNEFQNQNATMMLVLYIILFIYCLAIIALIYGFTKINSFDGIGLEPKTKFSIIVPFRNEAGNLPKLLNSLSKLLELSFLLHLAH